MLNLKEDILKGDNIKSKVILFVSFLVMLFCFFSFQYSYDLSHTVSSTFALLDGHILDFYDYCKNNFTEITYMPTMFIIFAIWNIPIKLLGLEPAVSIGRPDLPLYILLYNKFFLCIIYILTALFIYKIFRFLSFSKKDSSISTLLWVVTPLSVFVQFCLGLYDILTVFFMVVAIYYFLKNREILFILFFAIAVTGKSIALIYFFPFVFLSEKRICKILLKTLGCLSLYILYILIFMHDESFISGVFGFNIKDMISVTKIWNINLFIVVCITIMACAYFQKEIDDKKSLFIYSVFYCNLCSFAFFGLCLFHPNWVLLATPFIIFSLVMHRQKFAYLWTIIIVACAYFVFFCKYARST